MYEAEPIYRKPSFAVIIVSETEGISSAQPPEQHLLMAMLPLPLMLPLPYCMRDCSCIWPKHTAVDRLGGHLHLQLSTLMAHRADLRQGSWPDTEAQNSKLAELGQKSYFKDAKSYHHER